VINLIKIIPPAQFNTSLWKNGQGKTTELAISEHSSIDNFNWRLSIATISNDGLFSKFIGYNRQHVVLSGNGILLKHQNLAKKKSEDRLPQLLNFASFSGDNTTFGELINGPITAFNLMYKPTLMHCELQTYPKQATIMLNGADQYFIYSDTADLTLSDITNHKSQLICKQHLIKITNTSLNQYEVSGKQMIIIRMSLN
jgi:environmental stress-induced protein Ves